MGSTDTSNEHERLVTMADAKILMWDTELSPMKVYTWSLYPDYLSIDKIIEPQRIICFGYRWYGTKSTHVIDERAGHRAMIDEMHAVLDEADFLVSWNGQSFDTRHAQREFTQYGITPPSPRKEIDLMRVAKKNFKFASNKLDHIAQELGLGQKADTGGFQLWRDILEGDEVVAAKAWRTMIKYQKQDVDLLIKLYEHFRPWVKFAHPVSEGEDKCRACSSFNLVRRGYANTLNGKYPKYRCEDCGHWTQSAHRVTSTNMREIA